MGSGRARRRLVWVLAAAVLCAAVAEGQSRNRRLRGRVKVDGSSTAAPIVMATAELFRAEAPRVQVTVGISGTGGGFKKFLTERANLRTDITNASRPIKPAELKRAKRLGVEFIEIPVAYDGIAVVVNPANDWCTHLTIDELRRIWQPGSQVKSWKDVRPGFPDVPLHLYGPGTDSGTFDYFVETVVGRARACRGDYTPSEDDNVLVQGVAGDRGALGYFGYSYYAENKDKLRLVGIKVGDRPPVKPDPQSIRDGRYHPLSRPLLMYVNKRAYQRPEVRAFMHFLLKNARRIVEDPRVSYVALDERLYRAARERLEAGITGSPLADPANRGKPLEQVYGQP